MFKGRMPEVKWLFKNAKPVMWQILILTLLGVAISYISVRFALASRDLLDSATSSGSGGFLNSVIRIALLLVLDLSVQSAYNILSVRTGSLYKNKLQKNLFSAVTTTDFSCINTYHSGEIINRLTKDIKNVSDNIIDLVPAVIMLVTGVVFSFVALAKLDMSLALICIALGPVVLATSTVYGRKIKKLHSKCLESDGKILSFMQECIQNLLVIKAFGKEKFAADHNSILQKQNYNYNMKAGYISLLVNVMYFLALTAAYYFAVAWCAYKISIGIMTVGAFAAIIQLVGSVQTPFREISGSLTRFFATCASCERIMEVENLAKDKTADFSGADFDRMEVKDLCFSYGDREVLKNISFEVQKGDTVVITGQSGKGKSTLMKLLLGIYPPEKGEIAVYDNEEKIILDSGTRSLFSYVPQGNMIISGSIGENISFFEEADEKKVRDAAEAASILQYIDSLPDGMNTVIGENGLGLSEGQTQRLAIARAVYADSPIILLDEATSALDEETEAEILRKIKKLKTKTCIIITHRPKALEISDKRLQL